MSRSCAGIPNCLPPGVGSSRSAHYPLRMRRILKQSSDPSEALRREVRYLKGVGPKRAEKLSRLGIECLGDLLLRLPRDYEDRRRVRRLSELKVGEKCVINGRIVQCGLRPTRSLQRGILEVWVEDETGVIKLVWFNATDRWRKSFPVGAQITAYGEVQFYNGLQMVGPDYRVGERAEDLDTFGSILPVYPLTEGISQRMMRGFVKCALQEAAQGLPEVLPPDLRARKGFASLCEALQEVHFPPEMQAAKRGRRRLAYEELFVFQTALALRRRAVQQSKGIAFKVGPNVDRHIRSLFPFEFTESQDKVIAEVRRDMRSERPMNRLLQGDVGCGKTVVAVYAMLAALAQSTKGYQAALMAPTEILAEQHYLTLQGLLERAHVRTLLLTGESDRDRRRQNLRRIAEGQVDLVVGTHALIQKDVEFRNLALAVVDEQHRFGVRQRLALTQKRVPPDVLIMTATPIPRTLAMAYFADMDISIIDHMPPGRKPVRTYLHGPERWQEAFSAALQELRQGYRAFVVYPLVEESQQLDLTSARRGYEELSRGVFRDFDCALLHGQMRSEQKQTVMEGFREGRYRVLVATTVVEVGIDVPEATVMIVQHAERLGLAQLHQLRGRIGRGDRPGKCYLLAEPGTEDAFHRLKVLTETCDGFKIAEEDLRIRGPGELFGTKQSGMPQFNYYDFCEVAVLEEARDDAFALVRADPSLSRPQHANLRREVLRRYGKRFVFASIG